MVQKDARGKLSCGNLAHGFAACEPYEKDKLSDTIDPNIGIITAYNDMLSAHKPYEDYPKAIPYRDRILKTELFENNGY